MKVLFIGKCSPDYLCDSLIHGMYGLLGEEFTHNKPYDLMYADLASAEALSKRFTLWGDLPEYINDNDDIAKKIENHHYSLIIYGNPYYVTSDGGSCMDHLDLVGKHYSKSEVFFLDGEDAPDIHDTFGYPLFKRELQYDKSGVYPISFAIPISKITTVDTPKTKRLADYKPGMAYAYGTEEEYYQGYRESLYGLTHKKSGWDCMRHYEILANKCIPYFPDIRSCPSTTMVSFPKSTIVETNRLFDDHSVDLTNMLEQLFDYTRNNLTTLRLAEYILSTYTALNTKP